jgi:hypothetical protein
VDEVQEALWVRLNALRAERNAWYAVERIVILSQPRQAIVAEIEQVEAWFKALEEAKYVRRSALEYLEEKRGQA